MFGRVSDETAHGFDWRFCRRCGVCDFQQPGTGKRLWTSLCRPRLPHRRRPTRHHGRDYYGGYRTARYGYGYGGGDCYGGRSVWHDTSHYDYHPGEVVRHRNHYHYVPGHYDFHETGHWDHYGW